ncbi:MAG: multidrug effflux MFS transporter [Actinomycetota bacterium]
MTNSRGLRMGQNELVVFLATISATTALGIDMILPAFGAVREAFGLPEDSTSVALTVTTYFLGMSVSQILYGPLADRFGRKPVLLFGIGLYGSAAIFCGLATNLTMLLVGRTLWGLGAAGPRVLLMAIARDVYDGDRLAKVLSMAAALFMIVPAIAPLLGQGVLSLTNWRGAFAAPAIPALMLGLWTVLRLDETLPPEQRRPLTLGRTRDAFKAVVTNRTALGYALSQMFDFASFASFLATTELLFDRVYDREEQFALYFSGMSLVMGVTAFVGSRVVSRFGAQRMILALFPINLLSVLVLLIISIAASGSPAFLLWFGLLTLSNATRVLINPLAGSESMQPMGELAGTAASVMGTIGMGGGAILASFTDRFISDSVTPLSAAYLFYGIAGFCAVLYAVSGRRGRTNTADPVTAG